MIIILLLLKQNQKIISHWQLFKSQTTTIDISPLQVIQLRQQFVVFLQKSVLVVYFN